MSGFANRIVTKTMLWAAFAAGTLSGCAAPLQTAESVPTEPLVVYGASGVVELAPVHLTYAKLYPNAGGVRHGGVRSLITAKDAGDLATNAETQLLLKSLDRPDLRIIGTVAEGVYRIVGRRSAGVETVADLKGKRIGTMLDSSSGYFLHLMLEREGLSLQDVEIVDLRPFSAIADALVEGDVDAISIWEPHSENAIRRLGPDAVTLPGNEIYTEKFNMNATASVLADPSKRSAIVIFIRNLIRDTEAMNADPAAGQAMVAAAGGYTMEELRAAWSHHRFAYAFPDDMLEILVDEEQWLATLDGRAPRTRSELAKLIDRSVYEEAIADPQ